jgi:hypothetical protein
MIHGWSACGGHPVRRIDNWRLDFRQQPIFAALLLLLFVELLLNRGK